MPVQVTAQAGVIRDAVASVELQPSGDLHGFKYTDGAEACR
jgi:hypothetical protein